MKTFGFQWHLSDRCNRRCAHCYQERFDGQGEPGLELLKEWAQTIAHELGDTRITANLTGGEPLVLPHLFQLIDHLTQLAQFEQVNLITNGTLLDGGLVERLASRPIVRELRLSLESSDASINDSIRGGGHLKRLTANLSGFHETGKTLVLMLTLSRLNLGTLTQTIAWAREQKLHGVIVERFVPLGRGQAIQEQVLRGSDWLKALRDILSASACDLPAESLAPYRALWIDLRPDTEEPLSGAMCNLGNQSMALMPDGNVYPCRRLPLSQGNVSRDPFPLILERLKTWSPQLQRPQLTGQVCPDCPFTDCAGCRATALAQSRDLLADDPICIRAS